MNIPSVAITQSAYNKLGKLVDYVLTIPLQEQPLRIGAMSSPCSSLIVVDLLYYGLVKRNKEEYAQKIINTRRIIQEMEK
ncbi:sIS domain protein [Catenibacterium sp. CAG:290]|uniref:SIS domain protein n=1 Tax=Catenibacterium sp. CAG:290 TaxID=1262767 RepID=UPI00033EB554|nr:SIS domain protein [Catenibacterium sp. CAG:290]CDE27987.1 sIS domain protein [Catenibacterium sp. CAG:290]